ncbi:hypothetical protein A9P44_18895 [Paenibacillus polymyxa]|nr:hypothetical protein A9P44_18895 [Paenibacillus polymyxa]
MTQNQLGSKKERTAFVIISALAWLIVVLLIFKPKVSGTRSVIEVIYKPLHAVQPFKGNE